MDVLMKYQTDLLGRIKELEKDVKDLKESMLPSEEKEGDMKKLDQQWFRKVKKGSNESWQSEDGLDVSEDEQDQRDLEASAKKKCRREAFHECTVPCEDCGLCDFLCTC